MRKIKKIVLGYSVLADYRRCPTSFKYRYVEGLNRIYLETGAKGSPLVFGEYVHRFMERYHTGAFEAKDLISQITEEASKTSLYLVEASKQRSIEHLTRLLEKYAETFTPLGDFKPVLLEGKPALEYECDFILSAANPQIVWRQHYDGVIEVVRDLPDLNLKAGDLAILEHKTSSGNLLTDLAARMEPNAQARGYVYGARNVLGLPVKGVLFNGLSTYRPLVNPGYKPRFGNDPAPLFHRHLVEMQSWHTEEWLEQTMRDVLRMLQDITENVYGANAPDACTVFSSRCKFSQLCTFAPKDRNTLKEFSYTPDPWRGFKLEYED